ncbi:LPXTG cell wall anchor domain-containing protein [Micromonospora sagamiensis]|uniref:LPXTG-motif cell wall-anchored protein n=1 Tax=Micromonospora sagamiensis TaxID=47875 RepID=A0A562WKD6_9ACTN|nr:LPXTG cell wall anchor domain-containing protein [Micromonospora sagamiensis]TWJ30501.1 LPXTG-motif cell wall-anchored protein [Micromonospora sagamiensis]BCL16468.1 hypothetical protein GCM10017556_42070 [Micromonospora sagamiensis]
MPQRRHLARAVVSAVAATTVLALATPAWAATTLELRQSNVTAGGFANQECADPRFADLPDDHDGWHFVLPERALGDLLSLKLTFTDGSRTVEVTIPDDSDPYPDALYATGGQNPQLKHAYLFTPAGWTLVTGTASVTGEGSKFNLSHTCAGQPSATPTPTPTGSASPSPDGSATPNPGDSASPTPDASTTPTPDGSVTPSTSASPSGGTGGGGGDLPLTGAAVTTMALLGVGLVGGGATLVLLRRRRDDVTFTS